MRYIITYQFITRYTTRQITSMCPRLTSSSVVRSFQMSFQSELSLAWQQYRTDRAVLYRYVMCLSNK